MFFSFSECVMTRTTKDIFINTRPPTHPWRSQMVVLTIPKVVRASKNVPDSPDSRPTVHKVPGTVDYVRDNHFRRSCFTKHWITKSGVMKGSRYAYSNHFFYFFCRHHQSRAATPGRAAVRQPARPRRRVAVGGQRAADRAALAAGAPAPAAAQRARRGHAARRRGAGRRRQAPIRHRHRAGQRQRHRRIRRATRCLGHHG